MKLTQTITFLFIICIIASCRKDRDILPIETEPGEAQPVASIEGLYLLNQGNMGSNQASLNYYDYATGILSKNIYQNANPDAVKELGDVGNDIGIYGNKLYAIINVSNKVEIMDVNTAKRIKTIEVKNCRYIIFHNGKAYVSAFEGVVSNAPNGTVSEIDTATLEITRKVEVGRQPEQMAIVDNKLYIANSGGYSAPNYERTVSVIDLNSFSVTKNIDVAINLHLINKDNDGDIYVSSRGDYHETPARYYVIDTKADTVKKVFNIAVNGCDIVGDTAYIYGTEWSYEINDFAVTYNMINTKTETLLNKNFITDGTEQDITMPYGIAIDPISRYIYLTDAKDFVSSGFLYCYTPQGKKKFSIMAENIPACIAFKYKNK